MNARHALAASILAGVAFAAAASADPDVVPADSELAAPGACAQPRGAARTDPVEEEAGTPPLGGDAFELAGPPVGHFDPTQVAADLPRPDAVPFADPRILERQACDSPDAGCSGALTTQALPTGSAGRPPLIEQPPVGGLPPGAGGDR